MRKSLAAFLVFSLIASCALAPAPVAQPKPRAPGVFRVTRPSEDGMGWYGGGNGFLIRIKQGIFLMTAAHVCGEAPYLGVVEGPYVAGVAVVVKIDKEQDLCLLLPDAHFMKREAFAVAKETVPVSNVELRSYVGARKQYRRYKGWVSSLSHLPGSSCLIARIHMKGVIPGTSGSPIFNSRGQVTGVVVAYYPAMDGGVAVTAQEMQLFLKDL